MKQQDHLTQSIRDEAAALMAIACEVQHADWCKAIDRICDIEKSLPSEARSEFYALLSDHV